MMPGGPFDVQEKSEWGLLSEALAEALKLPSLPFYWPFIMEIRPYITFRVKPYCPVVNIPWVSIYVYEYEGAPWVFFIFCYPFAVSPFIKLASC